MEIGTEMLTPVARIVPSRLPPHSARPLEHSAIPTVNDRILSTDHKVESQLPGTKRFTIEMNDTNFMEYQRGRDFTTGAEGEVELPKAIQDAMLFFSKLNLQQRNGQCISVSADLMNETLRNTPDSAALPTPGAESRLYFMGGAGTREVAEKIVTGKYATDKGPTSVVSVQYAVPEVGSVAHYRTYARTDQGLYAGI